MCVCVIREFVCWHDETVSPLDVHLLFPFKIIILGYNFFFCSTLHNSNVITGDVQIWLDAVFGWQKFFITKEFISASVLT